MSKEWVFNMATNRWGLNKKDKVGPVAQWIRECSPKAIIDWKSFYFKKLSQFLKEKGISLEAEDYLKHLGQKLYTKITEVLKAEIEDVTEEECIEYIQNLVINRTFDGFITEINTIYGQLQKILNIPIKPAPDEWDRLYNVDFYIEVNNKFIGLQIKPITYEQTPQIHKWKEWLTKTHNKFESEKGGKVFIIFSIKKENKKIIYNFEVINDIKKEIEKHKRQ
ncbi:MAG: MjaI family restriction endonuclease [Candidatus Aenigmatarchaeota archaeon]